MDKIKNKEISGLVLAGGKSSRMKSDKSTLEYHGIAHEVYTAKLLNKFCHKTYISKSSGASETNSSFEIIPDNYPDIGPIGGIHSAMSHIKGPILVLPCDLPFINDQLITTLIENRNQESDASCYINMQTKHIEPLIAIYEYSIAPKIQAAIDLKEFSLHKLLNKLELHTINLPDDRTVFNANDDSDYKRALKILNSKNEENN